MYDVRPLAVVERRRSSEILAVCVGGVDVSRIRVIHRWAKILTSPPMSRSLPGSNRTGSALSVAARGSATIARTGSTIVILTVGSGTWIVRQRVNQSAISGDGSRPGVASIPTGNEPILRDVAVSGDLPRWISDARTVALGMNTLQANQHHSGNQGQRTNLLAHFFPLRFHSKFLGMG